VEEGRLDDVAAALARAQTRYRLNAREATPRGVGDDQVLP